MGKGRVNNHKPQRAGRIITVGKVDSVPPGRGATVKLNDGAEIAIYNVNGVFHAIENFCPHKGYALADSPVRGTVVECEHHGWRFDVTSGHCFTAPKCSVDRYDVVVEDGWIRITV